MDLGLKHRVAPGLVKETLLMMQRRALRAPLGRAGRPGKFAGVVFLAGERAHYATGVSIAVDGGIGKGLY